MLKRHPLVKGLASGVGLISEYNHNRKEQKAAKSEHDVSSTDLPPAYSSNDHPSTPSDNDERQWQLDEAQDELEPDQKPIKGFKDPAGLVKQFTDKHPPSGIPLQKLSLPVVIPQRRPKDRTRGFIRAYAPILSDHIDQATFIEFIQTFNEATLSNPRLEAINLASFAFITAPTAISMGTSIAFTVAVKVARNMQSRYRQNYILDQLNDDFFKARGLYALVLTWNPESADRTLEVDINSTISARESDVPTSKVDKLKPSMGDTIGTAFELTAPLVFPALDVAAQDQGLKAKFKTANNFVGDYFDRRSQADHAGQNPGSQLAMDPSFKSKYANPNDATNSGDLVSLVSGGKYSSPLRARLQDRGRGRGDHGGTHGKADMRSGPIVGSVKRVFKHHVLYLAIVNMPSEDELAQASAYMAAAER